MLFCQSPDLTIVGLKKQYFFVFEPMKVPKIKEIRAKLINKIFVKNFAEAAAVLGLMEYFWFWH